MKEAAAPMRSRSSLPAFFGLSLANKLVLVEALVTLAWVSLAIRLVPFRRVVRSTGGANTGPAETPEARAAVARCRWAVERWAEIVPWRAVCFQKGLSLHIMLRRRHIASILHYGVKQDPVEGLAAHVWISEADRLVMGGEIAPEYTEVARFPSASAESPVAGPTR